MKLRNKKTGDIVDFGYLQSDHVAPLVLTTYENDKPEMYTYNSLAELERDWEDYEDDDLSKIIEWIDKGLEDEILPISVNDFVEELKAWKRLKDKGVEFYGWRRNQTGTYELYMRWEDVIPRNYEVYDDIHFLFGGDE